MGHFLAGSLEKKAEEDVQLRMVVSELFGHDESLSFAQSDTEQISIEPIPQEMGSKAEEQAENVTQLDLHRDNFLSQLYLASMGVVMAVYLSRLNSLRGTKTATNQGLVSPL